MFPPSPLSGRGRGEGLDETRLGDEVRWMDRRFRGIYAPGRGHPSGEVVDEGAYTYTAPSSTPSYLLIFAKRENNGGRDSGLAEDGQPAESHPGETQYFIFTFRENNRVPIFCG